MGPLFRSTRRWFSTRRNPITRTAPHKNRSRLMLQSLEGREVPAALVVTDAGDTGTNTLRGRIAVAIANGEADTITFDTATMGTTSITLTSGEMGITGENFNLVIDGGAGITINSTKAASATSRIFNVNVGSGDPTITFKFLTLSGGNLNSGNGGAVLVHNDTMVFENMTFSNNKTTAAGGAIASTSSITANVSIKNSNFDNNSAGTTGGAINATSTITLNIDTTTFNKNSASSTGGGMHFVSGNSILNIKGSTFTNQSSGSSGGAVSAASSITVDIGDSTFTGNRGTNGGAFRFASFANVIVNKSTVSGNTAATSTGGGFYFSTTAASGLTLTNSTVANNSASSNGGAIRMGSSGATISLSNITGNTSGSAGGGIYLTTGNVSVSFSSVSNNSAVSTGGGISLTTGTLTLDNSTVANNKTNSTSGGGGINVTSGNVTIRNSTISSNTAANGAAIGGGIRSSSSVTLNIHNSTMTNNTASGAGGGGFGSSATTLASQPIVSIQSSIIAQNLNTAHPDFYSAATTTTLTIAPQYSLIGADSGGSVSITPDATNITGTVGTPANALLAKLANYGGPTQTHAPQAGSPVLDKGFNFIGASTDQRGGSFNRIVDEGAIGNAADGTDMGAYEGFLAIPTVGSVTAPNVTTAGGSSYQVVVVYNDATGINTTTIDTGDISIAGPVAFTMESVTFTGPATSVTATYTFRPPTGPLGVFDASDNGNYTISVNASQVADIDANPVDAGVIGGFYVAIPQTFTVTVNTDEDDGNVTPGDLSIREAIKLANSNANSTDTIVFDNALAGSTIIITAVLGQLSITDPVVITGLGSGSLTLDGTGQANTRAFNIDMTTGGAAVSISGMKVQNFSVTGDGGGINNIDAALKLTDMWLHNNTASAEGGGLNLDAANATLVMENSLVSSNQTTSGDGGGINSDSTITTISIKNSTIRNNLANGTSGDGGGVMISGTSSTVTFEGSTLSGNTAFHSASNVFGGGALYFNGTGPLTFINSTISGNSAVAGGGGLHIDDTGAIVHLKNTTVANNAAAGNGGGINLSSGSPTLNLYSSIVAGNNTLATGEDIAGGVSATVNMEASAISDTIGFPAPNQTGFNLTNVDPLLGGLTDNGGYLLPDGTKVQTHALNPSSQAKDKGANSLTLTTDQRGATFLRQFGPGVDMGSFELVTVVPGAVADGANIPPANPTHVVTVTFTDETGINTGGIANGNIRIIGVGYTTPATPSSHTITVGSNGDKSVTVEYTFAAPGGSWDWWENGVYEVEVQGGQVFDTDGSPNSVPTAIVGDFIVDIPLPATLTVDKAGDVDDGKYGPTELTIREAVNLSNSSPTFETINFAGSLSGQTITLTPALGELKVTDALTITGLGASNLTLSGGSSTIRLFNFTVPGTNVMSTISGITLSDGKVTGSGGAILLNDDGLTLSSVTFNNNSASSTGGAIQLTTSSLIINNSTFTNNTSGSSGGVISVSSGSVSVTSTMFSGNTATSTGGVLSSSSSATVDISSSTITGNKTNSSGGGVYGTSATVTVTNSTVSNNSAGSTGGGITGSTGTINVTGSQVINNTAAGTGGGLRLSSTGKLNVTTSTVSGNTATIGGGVYTASGTSSITYSTIANNVATSTSGGGGLNLSTGTMTIQNSTISQNTATGVGAIGGAIRGSSSGTLTIDNSTITRNSAGGNGGGGLGFSGTTSTSLTNVFLASTIVAQNFNTNHPDLYTAATTTTLTANVNFSLIGADSGSVSIPFTGNNKTGTVGSPVNAKLDPLANYGGPTQTHQLQAGSPAINKGSNTVGFTQDQRGATFDRVIGANPDIGSFELPLQKVPVVFGDNPPNITTGGAPTVDVVVTFDDDVGVDISTISAGDFELRRAFGGASIPAASIVTSPGSGVAQPVSATITFNAPGGTWDGADTDRYYLWLIGTVSDAATPTVNNVVSPQQISQFDVTLATKAMAVDITADVVDGDFSPGKLSLREAVEFSNANTPHVDAITFALGINPQTITLNGTQISMVDPVSVTGPGVALLTIDGNNASRIFNINDGVAGAGAFALSGMVLTKGKSSGDGGAINIADESVTITNMTITGNSAFGAAADGGGINVETDGATLKVIGSTISNNNAGASGDADGGGINMEGATAFTMTNSTVDNNTAFDDGGGLLFQKRVASHSVLIEGSTISHNTSKATTGGGGGVNFGGAFSSGLTIRNSTVSGNTTSKDGAGLQFYAVVDTVTIQNTTIAYNTAGGATSNGGGINHHTDVTGLFNIESTIISNNDAVTGDDIQSTTGFVDSKYNAIGSYSVTNFTDSGGNIFAQNLLLSPLGGYGGPTQTIRPASNSPVVDKGSNPGVLTTDQRGATFARTIDAPAGNATDGTDIGSYEVDPNIPAAAVSLTNVTTSGGTTYTFTVTYTDDVAIDVSDLDDNDITVTGPNSFSTKAKFDGVDINTDGTPRVATYSFSPPGSSWNDIDNGQYTVTLNVGEVTDTAGSPNAVPGGALGNFSVTIPVLTTVTTLVDENDGPTNGTGVSLREAIALSNGSPTTLNAINFAPGLFTPVGAQTMTLTLGQMLISAGVTITGPGANELIIDGNNLSRIFQITDGATTKTAVTLSDMHLTKGQTTGTGEANAGGAVWVGSETINFNRMEFSNNTSSSYGGAIYTDDGAIVTIESSSLHHNTAQGGDTTQGGGAIQHMALSGATMAIRNSTFAFNRAGTTVGSSVGGAIILYSGVPTLVLENSTIVNNTAHQAGGLRTFSAVTGNIQIKSSIITDNTGLTSQPNFQSGSTPISFSQSLIGDTVGLGAGYSPDAYTAANVGYAVLLGPIQNNGGPTSTMELLASNTRGIDEGTNPSALSYDQRGLGFARKYDNPLVTNDAGSDGTDIGAFERQPAVPPTATVKIDSGTGQRSMIQSITVTFSEPVTLGVNPFTVERLNTSTIPTPNGTVTLNVAGSGSTYTITFNDSTFAPLNGSAKSLIDGQYKVTLNATAITSVGTGLNLDGDGNGTGGDNQASNFHRLFGDVRGASTIDLNGNGFTDNVDLIAFRNANGSDSTQINYDPALDSNADGFIDNIDLIAFRARLGATP